MLTSHDVGGVVSRNATYAWATPSRTDMYVPGAKAWSFEIAEGQLDDGVLAVLGLDHSQTGHCTRPASTRWPAPSPPPFGPRDLVRGGRRPHG
jgi:hypothetical protein